MKPIKDFLRKILLEGLTTLTNKMIFDIGKKNVNHFKLISQYSLYNGSVGLFRNEEDGNAYEIEIRPVSIGLYKDLWGDKIVKQIERDTFKPNKEEVLDYHQVKEIIASHFKGLFRQINLKKNDKDKFTFEVLLTNQADTGLIQKAVEILEGLTFFSVNNVQLDSLKRFITIDYKKI